MMSQTHSTRGRENTEQPHLVFTNDNLLTEILIRLPILCIHLFTTVSKQCLQILTSPDFTDRRRKIPNLDPPAGIFANHRRRLFKCEFVLLDPRLKSRKSAMVNSFTLGSNKEADHVKILQSCNGLLLCSGSGLHAFYYVYNPSTNLFKRLSQPENSHDDSHLHATGVLIMAFDFTKSRDYKVVQLFACPHSDLEIKVYSLEISNWSLCREQLIYYNFAHFATSIYWNYAFHWLENKDRQITLYKLNIDDHDHPIITTIEIPNGLHQGRNFLQSFGGREGSYDLMLEQIDIPGILHLQGRLFSHVGVCFLHVEMM
ncbi:hypothetical protein Tco_0169306 [Tanacetum coccineum]